MQYIKVSTELILGVSVWGKVSCLSNNILLKSEFIPRLEADGSRACHIECFEHVMGVSSYI